MEGTHTTPRSTAASEVVKLTHWQNAKRRFSVACKIKRESRTKKKRYVPRSGPFQVGNHMVRVEPPPPPLQLSHTALRGLQKKHDTAVRGTMMAKQPKHVNEKCHAIRASSKREENAFLCRGDGSQLPAEHAPRQFRKPGKGYVAYPAFFHSAPTPSPHPHPHFLRLQVLIIA